MNSILANIDMSLFQLDEEMTLQFQIAALQERLSQLRMKRCKCVIGGKQLEPCPVHPFYF